MRAVAHSPKFAEKVGVSQSVGKDFSEADKRMHKYNKGGEAPVVESKRKPLNMRRAVLGSDKEIVARGNRTPYEPMPRDISKDKEKPKLGRMGKMGYKAGGQTMKKSDKAGRALVKKSADTMGRAMKMNKGGRCYAKGGSIDGVAKKGKTKGKMC